MQWDPVRSICWTKAQVGGLRRGCPVRVDVGTEQMRQRHPARETHRRVPTGQAHRFEMPDPLHTVEPAEQDLPSPDGAVDAVAGAVEHHPEDRFINAVFSQERREVGVVVLDLDVLDAVIGRVARGP